jgi:hypothetical protein
VLVHDSPSVAKRLATIVRNHDNTCVDGSVYSYNEQFKILMVVSMTANPELSKYQSSVDYIDDTHNQQTINSWVCRNEAMRCALCRACSLCYYLPGRKLDMN